MHHTGKNKKYCPKCRVVKEEEYFAIDTAQNDQHDRCGWCRECVSKRAKKRRIEQTAHGLCIESRCKNKAEDVKKRCKEHLLQNRISALVLKGLDPAEVEKVKSALLCFNNVCPICQQSVPYGKEHIDHNHFTGKFRGILCGLCNRLLGIAKESTIILDRASGYLEGKFQ